MSRRWDGEEPLWELVVIDSGGDAHRIYGPHAVLREAYDSWLQDLSGMHVDVEGVVGSAALEPHSFAIARAEIRAMHLTMHHG